MTPRNFFGRFAPSYWIWCAAIVAISFAAVFVPSCLFGCGLAATGIEEEDVLPSGDSVPEFDQPVPEDVRDLEGSAAEDDAGVPIEAAEADADSPQEADAEETEGDAPEEVPPDTTTGDAEEPEDAAPPEVETFSCDPSTCAETCAGYGYPAGTCDGTFCVCGDGSDGGDGGTPEGAGLPLEDCFRLGDEDVDGLRDCADPDCSVLIWCLCEPACGRPECCRGGTCTPPETCP